MYARALIARRNNLRRCEVNLFQNKPLMHGRKILLPNCTQSHSHARILTHSLMHIHTHTHHTHTIRYTHHTHTIHTHNTHTHTMHTHCVTSTIRLHQRLDVVIIAENTASCHLGANAPHTCYSLRITHKISSNVVELWVRVLRAVYLFLHCLYDTVFSYSHCAHLPSYYLLLLIQIETIWRIIRELHLYYFIYCWSN
jgi:hypothetical protein